MLGPSSQYLEAVGMELPLKYRRLLRSDLYVTVLHLYTDRVHPHEAAIRIRQTAASQQMKH